MGGILNNQAFNPNIRLPGANDYLPPNTFAPTVPSTGTNVDLTIQNLIKGLQDTAYTDKSRPNAGIPDMPEKKYPKSSPVPEIPSSDAPVSAGGINEIPPSSAPITASKYDTPLPHVQSPLTQAAWKSGQGGILDVLNDPNASQFTGFTQADKAATQQQQLQQERQPHHWYDGLVDYYKTNNIGNRLEDMFAGWASGATPEDSIANGGTYVLRGTRDRKSRNQTIDWLQGKGYSKEDAQGIVNHPELLRYVFANSMQGTSPLEEARTRLAQAQANKTEAETNMLNPPSGERGTSAYYLNRKYGQPEPSFRWTPEGNLESIPGGSAALKTEASQKKEERATQGRQAEAFRVLDQIGRAEKGAGYWTTGLVGSQMGKIPGTQSYDLAQTVNNIKANVGFDKLQEMRNNSPTGGALGPVSDLENKLLQNSIAALEQSQSQEQFLYNLGVVKKVFSEIVDGPDTGHQNALTSPQGTIQANENLPSPKTREDYSSLPSGTLYVAPDGSQRRKP